jgi:hypothetical protein
VNRLGAVAFACCALALGCGDPPICESDVFIAIQTSEVSLDADATADGVQADIRVRTSVEEGEVTLEVFTSNDQPAGTATATVDATGVAIFTNVTLPSPSARLRASINAFCGDASDELAIPVAAGTSCAISFSPSPEDNTFFAPARVFNSLTDPDPATAGFQARIIVTTTPSSTVEIFENVNAADQSLGTFSSGGTGIVEFPRTLADGEFTYRAFCTSGTTAAVSPATAVVVDITPPTCDFAFPSPGATITPTFDTSPPLTDGIQLQVIGQVVGDDILNEPTTLLVGPTGGALANVTTTPIDASGRASGATTLAPPASPATFTFQFAARDHAKNPCVTSENYVVALDACNLVIAQPAAPVTTDADGIPANGSQIDIVLTVSPECEGRTVTSTCGLDSPSGVVTGGQVALRTDFCGTSPCELSSQCTFEVTNPDGVTTIASQTFQFDDLGPPTSIAVVTPALAGNAQITPASDADRSPTASGRRSRDHSWHRRHTLRQAHQRWHHDNRRRRRHPHARAGHERARRHRHRRARQRHAHHRLQRHPRRPHRLVLAAGLRRPHRPRRRHRRRQHHDLPAVRHGQQARRDRRRHDRRRRPHQRHRHRHRLVRHGHPHRITTEPHDRREDATAGFRSAARRSSSPSISRSHRRSTTSSPRRSIAT